MACMLGTRVVTLKLTTSLLKFKVMLGLLILIRHRPPELPHHAYNETLLAETAVLPAMKSVSRCRPACLPIVHIYSAVVVAIAVKSTEGF